MLGLALKSLRHRAALSLICVLACAVAVATLGASLGVGDALERELERLVRARRGLATDVLVFPRALSIPAIQVLEREANLAAVYDERGRARVPEGPHIDVAVLGIDDRYTTLQELPFKPPQGREAYISKALATALGVKTGDTILVDLPKTRALSASLLFGDRRGIGATVRLSVARVLGPSEGGEFTLRPSPDLPRTVFASLDVLAGAVAATESARGETPPPIVNRVLARATGASSGDRMVERVSDALALSDYGLRIESAPTGVVVHGNDATIDASRAAAVHTALTSRPDEALAYLATGIASGSTSIPYSVILGLSKEALESRGGSARVPQGSGARLLWLSEWAAKDLKVRPGARVEVTFDLWRAAGRLEPQAAAFDVAGIVPDRKAAEDRAVIPSYPGISDARSLAEWEPPFPIDLARIRPRDEAFWKQSGPSPKAYLPIETARELFGESGSRLTTLIATGVDPATLERDVRATLASGVPPFVRQDLLTSRGVSSALDFDAYFGGFSALLILSALLVAAAFSRFLFETRARELGVLRLTGWTARDVRRLCMREAWMLGAFGAFVGMAIAPLASFGLQRILQPVWERGVSESPALATPASLIASAIIGFFLSGAALVLSLRATLRREPLALLLGRVDDGPRVSRHATSIPIGATVVFVIAVAAMRLGVLLEGPGFFLAGASVLGFGLGVLRLRIARAGGDPARTLAQLSLRGLAFRPSRVLFVATLLSSATFVVFAVSSFARRDTSDRSPRGPRGGFDLMVETSSPVFDDLGTDAGRRLAGIADDPLAKTVIHRFRLREGEDTSCLNLQAPRSPRLLGVTKAFRDLGRFPFASSPGTTGGETSNPWSLLASTSTPEDEIPAIIDANSLQYVLHKSLGDTMEIRDGRGRLARLKFVATLKETALRSEILIAEEAFAAHFPESEGYRVFLVEAPTGESEIAQALRDAWRERGALVSSLSERLARYYEVENTYLSSFQWLGALAAALSMFTLVAVAARATFERRSEWFVLRAAGFAPRDLRRIVAIEIAVLAVASVSIGAVAAALALFPLPRASYPAPTLTLLFPLSCALSVVSATYGAFRVLDRHTGRPEIGQV